MRPRCLAQVALDLPAGTHRAGQTVYRLTVDEAHTTGDVNPNNNAVPPPFTFACRRRRGNPSRRG